MPLNGICLHVKHLINNQLSLCYGFQTFEKPVTNGVFSNQCRSKNHQFFRYVFLFQRKIHKVLVNGIKGRMRLFWLVNVNFSHACMLACSYM